MGRENLEQLIPEKTQVGLQIAHLLSERLRQYETRRGDLTLKGTTAHLANLALGISRGPPVVVGPILQGK